MSDDPLNPTPNDPPPSDPPADPPPSDPPADPPPSDPPADNWRNGVIESLGLEEGSDASKYQNMLERFTDPASMHKAFFEAQDTIRKGAVSTGLPENPTDEQLAEFREANGIPGDAAAYAEGMDLDEEEMAEMKDVFDLAHKNNLSKDGLAELLTAVAVSEEEQERRHQAQDGLDKQEFDQIMKDQWGPDYQTNMNMIDNMINRLPESVRDSFKSARLADGRSLLASPEMMQFFAATERSINPAAALVPNSINAISDIKTRRVELEKMMGEPDWHKNTAANAEYDKILATLEQMGEL